MEHLLKNHQFIDTTLDDHKIYIFRVEYRDMSSMTKKDFVSFMHNLLTDVFNEYEKCQIEEFNLGAQDRYNIVESHYLNDYYNKKKIASYKRESSKQKFIDKLKQKAKDHTNTFKPSTNIFFDLMPMLHYNDLPTFYGISKDFTDELLERIYDKLSDIIKQSSGVVFKYDCCINNRLKKYPKYLTRPEIEFILPDKMMNEFREKMIERQRGIQSFYDGLKYKGD